VERPAAHAANFEINVETERRRAESRAVKFRLLAGFCCATASNAWEKSRRRGKALLNHQGFNFALC
jgi:hypothetical protein